MIHENDPKVIEYLEEWYRDGEEDMYLEGTGQGLVRRYSRPIYEILSQFKQWSTEERPVMQDEARWPLPEDENELVFSCDSDEFKILMK